MSGPGRISGIMAAIAALLATAWMAAAFAQQAQARSNNLFLTQNSSGETQRTPAPAGEETEAGDDETPEAEKAPDAEAEEDAGQAPETEEAPQQQAEEPAAEAPAATEKEDEKPAGAKAEIPEIYRDLSTLPFPARKMHELISEAAAAGDIEKLRSYIGSGDDQTMLSFGGTPDDPIEFLKSLSGDEEGHEILAILKEVLEAGFVKLDEGTDHEMYVWPYFYGVPLGSLTPPQRVEMYRLLTHGDYEDMKMFGAYVFYRLGITPEGRWQFFVAGD